MAALRDQEALGNEDLAPTGEVEELIYTTVVDCRSNFRRSLQWLASNGENTFGAVLRKLEKRFLDWAAYLGVFASTTTSLDQRLKRHPKYRDLILLVLEMLNMNLSQVTAQPSEPSSDESSDEGSDGELDKLKVQIDGIQKSINELDRLAIQIRQSSNSSLDARVKSFSSRKPTEVASFETKAILSINKLYPEASEYLRRNLSKSMTQRHTKLLYWQSHDRKLRADRRQYKKPQDHSVQIRQEPPPMLDKGSSSQSPVASLDEFTAKPKEKTFLVTGSLLSETVVSDPGSRLTLPTSRVEAPSPRRAGASTVLANNAIFPSPPRFENDEVSKPCPYCRKTFLREDFVDNAWWRCHVNEDLLPFVCLSSSCMQYPSFASRSDWRAHTLEDHGVFWQPGPSDTGGNGNQFLQHDSRDVPHSSRMEDVCPLCCMPVEEPKQKQSSVPVIAVSSVPQALGESLTLPSETKSTAKNINKTTKSLRFDIPEKEKKESENQTSRGDVSSETKTGMMKNSKLNLMINHIAEHLQFLALLTPRLSVEKLAVGEIHDYSSWQEPRGDQASGERSTLEDEFGSHEGDESQAAYMEAFEEIPKSENGLNLIPQDGWPELMEHVDWGLYSNAVQPSQRFALLVGIDFYEENEKNDHILSDMRGCVNDANAFKDILQERFKVDDITALTSSPPAATGVGDPNLPTEHHDSWPTFENIQKQFSKIHRRCNPGDIFFFYYSGQGALLKSSAPPPINRRHDTSILPMDFYRDETAIRSWQLNQWLMRLNDKQVQVIVILDCAYSSGMWQDSGLIYIRPGQHDDYKPNNESFPSKSIDKDDRYAQLSKSSISNADRITFMTACNSDQIAAGKRDGDKCRGVFTLELLKLLSQSGSENAPPTYRDLHRQVSKVLEMENHQQNPQVFGDGSFVFLDNYQPLIIHPVIARVETENEVIIEIGAAHGVNPGTEFKPRPFFGNTVFRVTDVKDWKCRAIIPPGFDVESSKSIWDVVPSRWGLGAEACRVLMHYSFGAIFHKTLQNKLQGLLSGPIEIIESKDTRALCGTSFAISPRGKNGADISGPPELIGYEESLRGIELQSEDTSTLAIESAMIIGRLVRFSQILFDIPKNNYNTLSFSWDITSINDSTKTPKKKFSFTNTGKEALYLTVLNLNPGFGIDKVWPAGFDCQEVWPQRKARFAFQLFIPNILQNEKVSKMRFHRDIIRIAVSNNKWCRWKLLEMPDIWEMDDEERFHYGSGSRTLGVPLDDTIWCMEDKEILTTG